ncbi:MAG: M23 family metallopeptidase [Polyangiaceae bacterium]
MIPSRSLLTAGLIALSTSALAGCHTDQAPPPRYPAPPPPVPGAPLVYYRFPFLGKWRVHRTHYGTRNQDQAFALDLVPEGSIRDKKQNSGYPCYNQPVVADAPGVIATAVDGVPENVPGEKNGYDQHGNYVVIDHGNGEFSLMAHLIPGSLKVRPGMQVQAGMELGRCGNSGLSTMPHIHWQVMTNANPSVAQGIQPRFTTYTRNGNASVDRPEAKDTCENR